MNNSPAPTPDPIDARSRKLQRDTFWVGVASAVLMGIALLINLFYEQRVILSLNAWLVVAGGIVAAVLARFNRHEWGAWVLIGALVIGSPVSVLNTAGNGLLYGIITFIMISGVAIAAFPVRLYTWAFMIATLSGLGAVFIDILGSANRSQVEINSQSWLLVILILVVFLIFIGRRFFDLPLALKLNLSLLGVTMLSILVVVIAVGQTLRTELTRSVGVSIKALADSQALQVASALGQNIDALRALTLESSLVNGAIRANLVNSNDPLVLDQRDQQWRTADSLNNNDDPLVANVLNNGMSRKMREFATHFPAVIDLLLTDQYSSNIAATSRGTDYFHADEDWWQASMNQQVYIGPPEFDSQRDAYVVVVALAMPSSIDGNPIGVLYATLNANFLAELVSQFSATSQIDLRFPGDVILSGDAAERARGLLPIRTTEIVALRDTLNSYAVISYKNQPSLVSQVTVVSADPLLKDVFERLNWAVIVHQDQDTAFAPVNTAVRTTFWVAIIALLVSAGVVFLVTKLIADPILRLTQTAEQVAAGNLLATASVTSNDEIGALASTFNSMTSQLRDTLQDLEQRVADRTKALETSAEVSRRLASILDPRELASAVVDQVQSTYNYYYAQIYLFDEARENLVLTAGTGEAGAAMLKRGHALPKGRGLVGRAAESKVSILVSDTTQDSNWLPNDLLPDTRAEAAIPILLGDEVLGVLDVQDSMTNDINATDITLLESLAAQVAISLQNATSYARAEAALQEAKLLTDYAAEGIAILDLTTGLFVDPNENAARIYGMSRAELATVGPAQVSPPRQPDGRDSNEKALEQIGLAVQTGFNVFEWYHRNAQGREFPCEIRLVRLPGEQPRLRVTITDITERKRIEELTRQRAQQQTALNTITQKIQSAATIEEAMQVAARELGHALGQKPTLVTLEARVLNVEPKSAAHE